MTFEKKFPGLNFLRPDAAIYTNEAIKEHCLDIIRVKEAIKKSECGHYLLSKSILLKELGLVLKI